MLTDEIKKFVNQSVLCWLATASKEGIPNVSPKEAFTAYGNSNLLIANIASPQSIRNILENEQVCVSFIDIFIQKGYQLKGKAVVIPKSDQTFNSLVGPLVQMVGEKFPIASVINVSITGVKPIIAPSYILFPEITEEEQRANAMKMYKVQASQN